MPMDFETFINPPITEAILDISAVLPEGVDLARLASFQDAVVIRFPTKKEKIAFTQKLEIKEGVPQKPQAVIPQYDGYLFADEGKKVVQARLSGFTFNRLPRYDNWKAFSEEGRELWEKYRNLTSPVRVGKIGLRYLNRIDLPLPVGELRDFCLLIPDIPKEMPQSMAEFFLRYVLPDYKTGAMAIVTVVFAPPLKPSTLSLIIDIEAFFTFDYMPPDTDELWKRFEILRDLKNKIFFSSITDQTRKLFK